ncbi:MAG: IS1595 family transposase [Planctomycetes bacterium]|nr:IS1595 family transposase [Planctomycetota bacterium]
MPAKNPPTGTDADLNLVSLSKLFVDEDAAREFLESKRWPNGPVCPRCGCTEVYTLTPKPGSKRPVRPGVYKCKDCRKAGKSSQFTVRIGTIFEESKIPLRKWLMAIHLMTSSKKGISSHQIARELDITVKSAWFVTHRVREAMPQEPMAGMLKGELEADETYVGPRRPRYKGSGRTGRGTLKQPVMALLERDGRVHSRPVSAINTTTLRDEFLSLASRDSTLFSDELRIYVKPGREFSGGHHVVKHKIGEYVRRTPGGDVLVTTNTVESFFALLKRGHYGIFHLLSKRHLHRYCAEFDFRWNHRKVSDGERMVAAIQSAEGKRLMYRDPQGQPPA